MSRIYEERMVKTEVQVGGFCDVCKTEMGIEQGSGNIQDGAELVLRGWYGGAIDPWPEDLRALLCSSCTRKAVELFFPNDLNELGES